MQTSLRSRETHSAPPQRAGRWEHKPSERAPSLREQGFYTFALKRHCGAFFDRTDAAVLIYLENDYA